MEAIRRADARRVMSGGGRSPGIGSTWVGLPFSSRANAVSGFRFAVATDFMRFIHAVRSTFIPPPSVTHSAPVAIVPAIANRHQCTATSHAHTGSTSRLPTRFGQNAPRF